MLLFSWKDVFIDLESGIDYYMWSVGSEPGYTDIMPYMKVVGDECGTNDKNNPLDLLDGHYYYINVRVRMFKIQIRLGDGFPLVLVMCNIYVPENYTLCRCVGDSLTPLQKT